jgi:hypothetical protein
MKATTILSGNFSTGENAQGNFSGYNQAGQRIFIFKQQMENVKMSETKDLKFPFFVLMNEREIETRDDAGELTGILAKRVQATAVFKTMDELITAKNSDAIIEIKSASALVTEATSAGMTKEQVNALLTVSI